MPPSNPPSEAPSSPTFDRVPGVALVAAAALLAGVALASAQAPGFGLSTTDKSDIVERQSTAKQSDLRVREGSDVANLSGYFRMTGDRVTFFTADGKGRFVGLENLNLQRIVQEIEDDPDTTKWIVSGTITEFRGANYLLVRQAMLERQ
jgi:hypothetical protein